MVKGYCLPGEGCIPNVRYAIKDVPDCVRADPTGQDSCHAQATAAPIVDTLKKEMEAVGYVCVVSAGSVQRMSLFAGGVALLASYFF